MDLVSSLRKEGTSRGGVNFSWEDVQTSSHRENYLGHSVMAPVGRWQKNKDLTWYAKADDKNAVIGETEDERKIRQRKEEIRKIKEAEEDALALALGLPVKVRDVSGANAIDVGEMNRVVRSTNKQDEDEDFDKHRGLGEAQMQSEQGHDFLMADENPSTGGLLGRDGQKAEKRRERSRSREDRRRRHHHSHRHRSPDDEGHRERRRRRSRSPDRRERRHRSRSPDRRDRRHRSRSAERRQEARDARRHREHRRRSASPEGRQRGRDDDRSRR